MRLDAYLARSGRASRREARGLIRRGRVEVDGVVAHDAAQRIDAQVICIDGEPIESPIENRDFVLHKPVGYACSHDEREAPLVGDLLSEVVRRRSPRIAGRLDRATTGLLILTVDGDFVHSLTHPSRKLAKRYCVEFEGELAADAVEQCAAGLLLRGDERPTLPAELELVGAGRATLILREGRTHQVRRMIRALGAEVTGLHRDRVGDLDLPEDLSPGEWRPLAPEERALLVSESSL